MKGERRVGMWDAEERWNVHSTYVTAQLTFVEARALRRTATVCSWDETSSIVFGRLDTGASVSLTNR